MSSVALSSGRTPRLPLAVKLGYTAFMMVLVPVYLHYYGPTNFLYFCDMALLITLVGVWTESPLLVSIPTVGIVGPQMLWVADFLFACFGVNVTGLTGYMFDSSSSLLLRGLSLFHGWLPFFLLYLVWRLGYDRRAFAAWSALACALMLISYFFMPGPTPAAGLTPVNIDYVYGLSNDAPQTWMPGWAWLIGFALFLIFVLCAPVHVLLKKWRAA